MVRHRPSSAVRPEPRRHGKNSFTLSADHYFLHPSAIREYLFGGDDVVCQTLPCENLAPRIACASEVGIVRPKVGTEALLAVIKDLLELCGVMLETLRQGCRRTQLSAPNWQRRQRRRP
jgi:hypothetical protein